MGKAFMILMICLVAGASYSQVIPVSEKNNKKNKILIDVDLDAGWVYEDKSICSASAKGHILITK